MSNHDIAEPSTGGHAETCKSRRPLRVCHVAYTFYESDNRVMRYAQALAERGDMVDVVALRRGGQQVRDTSNGVSLHRLQHRTKRDQSAMAYLLEVTLFLVRALFFVSARHARRRYDLIHVHNLPDFLILVAALPKLMGARVILDIHDVLPELYADKFRAPPSSILFRLLVLVERVSCSLADKVVVANDIWTERLSRRSARSGKVMTLLNYPDLRTFRPSTRAPKASDEFTILYPGSLSAHQGVDVAVRAFARSVPKMPTAMLHIYGEGPSRPALEALAVELDVADRVKIHGAVPMSEVADVMRSANLGVEPKLSSGFSNEALSTKILEFMASGVHVLASKTRAHSYYFDSQLLTFFQPGDADDMALALLRHYESPPGPDQIERSLTFAMDYGWERHRDRYLCLVDSLVGTQHATLLS